MKWVNKGHEFDSYWEDIKDIRTVYLFGAGLNGRSVLWSLKNRISVLGFLDNSSSKQGKYIEGYQIYALEQVKIESHTAVIVTMAPEKVADVLEKLRGKNIRAYDMYVFLPVFFIYRWNELLVTSISYLPTTVCNLKCKNCLNFSPYMKKQEFRDIERLKTDLDLFFRNVDLVLLFHVSGGEPFLYPDIIKLFSYLRNMYGKQIGRIETTTNGTILPTDELCEKLFALDINVVLDDYRKAVPQYEKVFCEILRKFDDYKVSYRIQKVDSWIDLNPEQPKREMSNEQAVHQFQSCSVPWQEYREGRIYLCNYSDYAAVAGLYETAEDEYFTLSEHLDRKELMEFRLGYSSKGYVNFCKQCDGYANNPNKVIPALQL